jgi:rare lipoprotein A (peptidoglycan hydrolase)
MKYKFYGMSLAALAIASTQLSPALSTPVTPVISPVQRPIPQPTPTPNPSPSTIITPTPKPSPSATTTPTPTPSIPNNTTIPPKETILFTQTGQASWYGYEGGTVTATGERYNPQAMTAAHKTLAFGSKVRVTNTRSGRTAIVTINDRGPFVRGRIIDLSEAAAAAVGIKGSGVGNVRIDVLSYGSNKRKARR